MALINNDSHEEKLYAEFAGFAEYIAEQNEAMIMPVAITVTATKQIVLHWDNGQCSIWEKK